MSEWQALGPAEETILRASHQSTQKVPVNVAIIIITQIKSSIISKDSCFYTGSKSASNGVVFCGIFGAHYCVRTWAHRYADRPDHDDKHKNCVEISSKKKNLN